MIYFNDEKHIYYNSDKIIYDSPSKILKKYKPQFNINEAADKYSRKHGQTPEYWKDEWNKTHNKALDRGTRIHTEKEIESYGKGYEKISGKIRQVVNAEILNITDLSQLPDGSYPEINIWNHGRKVAGRPDKVVVETINNIRYADVYDYKTNGSIDKVSYQFRDGTYKKLNKPVNHLMDSNWFHYALQLSIYMWILEAAGFVPRKLELIHIQHPVDFIVGQIQPPDTPYPLPYMKDEVLNILQDYNRGRIPQKYYGT